VGLRRVTRVKRGNGINSRQRRPGTGQLRIIAGRWRGRRLGVPDAPGLRPTGDRVRETLFNWLAPDLPGARCLDLFAGSGALGLEALSRGAAHCDFVERASEVARALQATLGVLGAQAQAAVHDMDAGLFLDARADIAYDLVFLDPPFADAVLERCCRQLEVAGCLTPGAKIYLEFPRGENPSLPENWESLRLRRAGAVCYGLYRTRRRVD
jgi:16S rRNA (guanine966-N2)-methyltransferase